MNVVKGVMAGEVINKTVAGLLPSYTYDQLDTPAAVLLLAPNQKQVCAALEKLIGLIFPGRISGVVPTKENLGHYLEQELSEIVAILAPEVEKALTFRWEGAAAKQEGAKREDNVKALTQDVIESFVGSLVAVRTELVRDLQATYDGDPAALTFAEIQSAFPGILAITSHRLAHQLYLLQVPIIPRIMSEWTHTRTGVDIHPGARIGSAFFIDHGTGIVIGETSVVGDRVKIYQGATLGAKSFALDEHGLPIKHVKRHPTVEDDVIIYANAVILGGDTVIGARSTIGAGVFVMESIPADSTVIAKRAELRVLPK